jgi:hypothetical protein
MIILYVILCIILFIILFWIQFKIRNPFWSLQPVIHYYQLYLPNKPKGIIRSEFVVPKFMNYTNITTKAWNEINDDERKVFQNHISDHFLKKRNIHYSPSLDIHITPYFDKDSNAYLSVYKKNGLLMGTIANRTLRIHLKNDTFQMSYIDFLCVHKEYRKKLVAPELIQSHEYFQRTKSHNKNLVSLFKKEGRLTNIPPLVQFYTYAFNIGRSHTPVFSLPSGIQLIKITKGNMETLHHFLSTLHNNYECFVIVPLEVLQELITQNSIHIYILVQQKEILSAFFFRETGTYTNSHKQNFECYASINNCKDNSVYINGFFGAIENLKDKFVTLYIESTSSNQILINHLLTNMTPEFISPCAYYIYNYGTKSVNKDKAVFIV